ncbi:MAG: transketolase family protein, partial [Anaerolineales bacterium]
YYNREAYPIVDHFIYAIVSDGDLMEGIGSEAASLAGHLRLGRLIFLYDDNRISIDGSTDLAFTEDRAARFQAYGWHVSRVDDFLDLDAIHASLLAAEADPRPSLIVCRTHIGYGLPTRQDTAEAHGEPPGEQELAGAKDKLGWPQQPRFLVPEDVRTHLRASADRGRTERSAWLAMLSNYRREHPDLAKTWDRTQVGQLPDDLRESLPEFGADEKGLATRAASGKTLNALAARLPELIGGSADLSGSNLTKIGGEAPFSASHRIGRYVHFGVREHGMGGMLSGMALYRGLIPYGGTFLIFSDYMRPSLRLAAMMRLRVIYVFTHDSIGLGEDGPTHQPIEHLAALRAIPNLTVIRPGDANETAFAWWAALHRTGGPTALALTRQRLPVLDRNRFAPAEGLLKGGYVLADLGAGTPQLILLASGSEVSLIEPAGRALAQDGLAVRLVSLPSWELFLEQSPEYRESVLPKQIRARISIEAASPLGWERWVGDDGVVIGLERFGASAPYEEIYRQLGLTVGRIVQTARELIGQPEPNRLRS